jgi:acyl-CoA oxidase
MSRKQLYKRALSLQKRVEELREQYGWSLKETEHALAVCDEAMPMNLHSVGPWHFICLFYLISLR